MSITYLQDILGCAQSNSTTINNGRCVIGEPKVNIYASKLLYSSGVGILPANSGHLLQSYVNFTRLTYIDLPFTAI